MKKREYILTLAVLILCSTSATAQTSKFCSTASRLSNDEARILLYVTPAAVLARRAGTDVDIFKSEPSGNYPTVDFFVAALISQKPTAESVLGNGILGYFAVDKRTGTVESAVDFTPVTGKELRRVQNWMRHSHCIQPQSSSTSHK